MKRFTIVLACFLLLFVGKFGSVAADHPPFEIVWPHDDGSPRINLFTGPTEFTAYTPFHISHYHGLPGGTSQLGTYGFDLGVWRYGIPIGAFHESDFLHRTWVYKPEWNGYDCEPITCNQNTGFTVLLGWRLNFPEGLPPGKYYFRAVWYQEVGGHAEVIRIQDIYITFCPPDDAPCPWRDYVYNDAP